MKEETSSPAHWYYCVRNSSSGPTARGNDPQAVPDQTLRAGMCVCTPWTHTQVLPKSCGLWEITRPAARSPTETNTVEPGRGVIPVPPAPGRPSLFPWCLRRHRTNQPVLLSCCHPTGCPGAQSPESTHSFQTHFFCSTFFIRDTNSFRNITETVVYAEQGLRRPEEPLSNLNLIMGWLCFKVEMQS